jgi:threonine/homoserine/homoserine lactone efflux protein
MIEQFWVFAITALLLNLTPGNDMLYVMARSSGQGVKAGIISSLGIMAGCTVHIIAAVIGLSALLAQSAVAFDLIKYVGAAYLVYLGIRSWVTKTRSLHLNQHLPKLSFKKIFWQGVLTNVLNPKVALFFLAFLPQFISASDNASLKILFLGLWFNIGGTVVNMLIAVLFGRIGAFFSKSPRFVLWQERITGTVLIALGIKVALSSKK